MQTHHRVIVVPGLGEHPERIAWFVRHWRRHGLKPMVHLMGWHDGEKEFLLKLQMLLEIIDQCAARGERVSLVGCSAGGSAVLNAFGERREAVHRVISISACLRRESKNGFPAYASRAASSPSFDASVRLFETNEHLLTDQDRKKIMTVRAVFGDSVVPADTTILPGAQNTTVPVPGHLPSIVAALTSFSSPLIAFLTPESE